MARKTFKFRLYPNRYQREKINQLPQIKEIRPDVAAVFSQVLQDVLRRLDKTYQAKETLSAP
jgi:hypothetical protein